MRVKHSNKIITTSLLVIALGLLSISSASALTYQSSVDMQFTFSPTVQIAVSGDLIIPDLAPGSSSDSNIITVTAGSNDAHGYTLYGTVGSSSSNYTDLRITSSDSTNKFTNLSSNKASLANFSDNTWGYSYSTDSGSTWKSGNAGSTSNGYNGLPLYNSSNNASGVILASTSSASETSLQFKIGAKAASTQVSGTYTNIINFIGVGKVFTTTYNLNYVDASSEGTGLPANLSSQTTNDGVIALSETTPTRTNYRFKGWCDTNNSSDPTTCSGTTYDPGRIYIIPVASQGGTVTINMYAIWESQSSGPSTLQEFAAAGTCSSMSTGDTMTLTDSRDTQSQEYTVAKLADGKCWMTTNLNLAGGTAISADDTDVDASYVSSFTTSNNLTKSGNTIVLPASSQSGFSSDNYSYVYNSTSTDCSSSTGCYGYYSWDAATLGSGRSISTDNTDAPYSICPKGWKLPTAYTTSATNWQTTSDFYVLAHQYGLDSTTSTTENDNGFYTLAGPGTTPNFQLAGWYSNLGPFSGGGSYGYYWSTTSYSSASGARYLFFFSSGVYSSGNTSRYYGYSIRCVARPSVGE